jgi:multiple sugar transport system permease protein
MSLSARVGETYKKRLIIFYIPMFMFLTAMLFPFYWMMISSVKPDRQLNSNKISPFFVWPRYMITEQTIKDLSETDLPKEILAKLSKMKASAILTDKSLAKLRKEKIPPDIITKLERLKDIEYIYERNFLSAAKKQLGAKRSIWYRSQLLRHAELKNQGVIKERFVKILKRKVGKKQFPQYESMIMKHVASKHSFTLEHWELLFVDTLFNRWAWNTFFIATVSTAISLFCAILAGYSLSRLKYPGSTTFGISIFVTYLVPPTLLFIPLVDVVSKLNLLDSSWSLILTYPTFLIPFSTWLLMGYFKTIPKELEECARIDGATRWQAMVKIILPVSMPGILSAGIFSFTLSWNEFLYALVFIASPIHKTIPVGVTSELIKGDVFFWGSLMAGALFGSIPIAFVYSFFVENYVSAMTGAVKG